MLMRADPEEPCFWKAPARWSRPERGKTRRLCSGDGLTQSPIDLDAAYSNDFIP
jgi:hypothetical protein